MRVATWNVNGLRARSAQLLEWLGAEQPDVVMLQEIKASPEQLPESLHCIPGYWCAWHGQKGYSGVGLLVREPLARQITLVSADFDSECRALAAELGRLDLLSVYVPNGGKSLPAKLEFMEAMREDLRRRLAAGRSVILAGDLNVARTDRDVHPAEKKPRAVGQLPVERALLEEILDLGLVDLGRAMDPDNDRLFTWWAPWRELRRKNVGWRIDYLAVSRDLAEQAKSCVVQREVGSSDHAPVVAEFDPEASKAPA